MCLQVMSHEIRTPLNAVVASVELLDTSNLDATQVTDCFYGTLHLLAVRSARLFGSLAARLYAVLAWAA